MRRQLADTLLLRTVETGEDVTRLVAFNSKLHSDKAEPDPRIGVWTAALLDSTHPTATRDDFFLVEDTSISEIVSTLCLIPQTWAFDGILFGVGRVELVGTLKEYRGRGLVRAQFEVLHERCLELGLPVQGITGIPYYYRQFGYEFATDLGGGQNIMPDVIPETPTDLPYTLRAWTPDDLPRLQTLHDSFARGRLVTCHRTTEHWHYRFTDTSRENIHASQLYVIVRGEKVVGYTVMAAHALWGPRAQVLELVLDTPYPEVVPWLVPRLRDEIPVHYADADPPINALDFSLGSTHPIYPYLFKYRPAEYPPYAWYLRVPDLAGFIRHVAPALERRVAACTLAGLTQVFTFDFYRGGLRLEFNEGELVSAEDLPPGAENADAGFPPLVFLQLLFGYRNLDELRQAFPDVWVKPEIKPVLDELFPRLPSWIRELY